MGNLHWRYSIFKIEVTNISTFCIKVLEPHFGKRGTLNLVVLHGKGERELSYARIPLIHPT
jgi:hypothetical protein